MKKGISLKMVERGKSIVRIRSNQAFLQALLVIEIFSSKKFIIKNSFETFKNFSSELTCVKIFYY